jgi:hypothetical protein
MKTWSIDRLICDGVRAVKGTAALFGLFLPPLTEPTGKVCRAHGEKVCIVCDEDGDALWVNPADGAEQLNAREEEEEVSEPMSNWLNGAGWRDLMTTADRAAEPAKPQMPPEEIDEWPQGADDERQYTEPAISTATGDELLGEMRLREPALDDEARERIGEVDDFVTDIKVGRLMAYPEPGLTDDELVAVRGLIQERYEGTYGESRSAIHHVVAHSKNFAGAAASLADGACVNDSSVRDDKQREPHPGLAPVAPPDGQAAPTPPAAACPSPSLVDWLEPAIREVLANHTFGTGMYGQTWCAKLDGSICEGNWDFEERDAWQEHVAPLIAERIERALRPTDFDFNQ